MSVFCYLIEFGRNFRTFVGSLSQLYMHFTPDLSNIAMSNCVTTIRPNYSAEYHKYLTIRPSIRTFIKHQRHCPAQAHEVASCSTEAEPQVRSKKINNDDH